MTTERFFNPEHEVIMYQARCTNCGYIEDDYGDFSAWRDPDAPRNDVVENRDWFERWIVDEKKDGVVQSHLEELLCPKCQECEVCQSDSAYSIGDHLVCGDHEDHEFAS